MKNIKTRIKNLESKLIPRTPPTQTLYVPKDLQREDWDKWVADHADGRPLFVFPEGLTIEECMAKVGVVAVSLDGH